MSPGVCGKRCLGFSETLGSSSSPTSTSPKRFRRSPPVVQQSSQDNNNNILHLTRLFPSMDRELVESVLNAHSHQVDDAIRYLNAICLGEVRPENETKNSDSKVAADGAEIAGTGLSEQTVHQPQEHNAPLASRSSTDMSLLIEECVEQPQEHDAPSFSPTSTSPKRFRRIPPVVQRSSEDNNNILHLMRMFPSMDCEDTTAKTVVPGLKAPPNYDIYNNVNVFQAAPLKRPCSVLPVPPRLNKKIKVGTMAFSGPVEDGYLFGHDGRGSSLEGVIISYTRTKYAAFPENLCMVMAGEQTKGENMQEQLEKRVIAQLKEIA